MSKKAIQIPNAPAPVGPYSQAVLMNGMYFVSGQIPLNPETGQLEIATIEEATHRVLKNIERLLEAAEMTLENVVKCRGRFQNQQRFPPGWLPPTFLAVPFAGLPHATTLPMGRLVCFI
jgi:2-iminobutanoate/2-iminopropanoate deaminase